MIYFDNSATTKFKPPCVVNAVNTTIKYLSANPGRASHSLSLKCASLVYSARKSLSNFIGLDNPNGIIFTANCSTALNLAIIGSLKRGHIVSTCFEHNSVLRPLFNYAKPLGCEISIVEPNGSGKITAQMIEKAFRHDTVCCIVNHVSNVTGEIMPIEEIGSVCKKHGAIFIVDGAQSVGKIPINMKQSQINLLAIAPHKGLHAICGVGALAVNDIQLKPIMFGGTGTSSLELSQPTEIPDGFEVGTLPLPAISSITPAINWVKKNQDKLKKIEYISHFLISSLSKMNGIELYSTNPKTGVVSFNKVGFSSQEVCSYLSEKYDICTRCGLHCAPLVHKRLKTLNRGAVRVSLGVDNTINEISVLLDAIKNLR